MSDLTLYLDLGVGIACFGMLLRVSGRLFKLEGRVVDVERRVTDLERKDGLRVLAGR